MIVAVLDTNVLASAALGVGRPESTPGELLRRWRAKEFVLVISEPIMTELARTLTSPYFAARIAPGEVETLLARVRAQARIEPIAASLTGVASHPEDDLILATALNARADYLATGDRALLAWGSYEGARLLSPRQFLAILEAEASTP